MWAVGRVVHVLERGLNAQLGETLAHVELGACALPDFLGKRVGGRLNQRVGQRPVAEDVLAREVDDVVFDRERVL
jgi:hypothetical protein